MTIAAGDRIPEVTLKHVRDGVQTDRHPHDCSTARRSCCSRYPARSPRPARKSTCPATSSTSTSSASAAIEVACMAVNDPFVMQAWGQSQHVPDGLLMLADGNGDFARALGLEMDASAYGMGVRSKRFALYADDGVVAQAVRRGAGRIQGIRRRTRACRHPVNPLLPVTRGKP